MSSTPSAALVAARKAIGWPRTTLAAAFGVDEKQIRRWEEGADVPDAALDWILALARHIEAHPPPRAPFP